MKLTLKDGVLGIENGNVMERIGVRLVYAGDFYNELTVEQKGTWVSGEDVFRCGNFTVEWHEETHGILLRTKYIHQDAEPVKAALSLQVCGGYWKAPIERCVYTRPEKFDGVRMASEVATMSAEAETTVLMPGQQIRACNVIAARDASGDELIFGFAGYERYFDFLTADADGGLTASQSLERRSIEQGEEILSDWLYIGTCGNAVEGLREFGAILKRVMRVGDLPEIPTGWCTWYYYLSYMDSADVLENMDFLSRNREKLPIRYIQIDDGWYDNWGDWEMEGFGMEMRGMAARIREAGYIPGIWLCPFSVDPDSKIGREHPEWMVQDGKGSPAGRRWALDATNPEAYGHLKSLIARLSRDWGFRYIKLDFVAGGLQQGVYCNRKSSSLMALREAYRAVREGATEDTFILGCTSPMLPAAGLVDGMRISIDIFEDWAAVKRVFRRVIKRYFYHNNAFVNDADCLIVRKKENEDEKCWRLCTRNDDEIRTYVTAMAASGGIFMLSDKMPLLGQKQVQMLSKLFPVNREAALPLDLMENDCPGILDFGVRGGTRVVAMINWSDMEKTMTLQLPEGEETLCWEFWSGELAGVTEGSLSQKISAHGCRLLFLTKKAPAVMIGADGSISPVWSQRFEGNALTVKGMHGRGWLYTEGTPVCAENASLRAVAPHIWRVMLHTRGGSFTVRLA